MGAYEKERQLFFNHRLTYCGIRLGRSYPHSWDAWIYRIAENSITSFHGSCNRWIVFGQWWIFPKI